MARDIDPKNLSADDLAYIKARPWLVDEFERQGFDLPESIEDDSDTDGSDDGSDEEESEGKVDYNEWTNKRLKDEINSRNADRDEEDHIVPEGTNKPELVAALEADDEAAEDEDAE